MLGTSVVIFVCQDEAHANLLTENPCNLELWCGLWFAHAPTRKHDSRNVLAIIYGGSLKPEQLPEWVACVLLLRHSGDLCQCWHRHKTAETIFDRRGLCSPNRTAG